MLRLACLWIALLAVAACRAQAVPTMPAQDSFDMRAGDVPQTVRTEGGLWVFHELQLANTGDTPLRVRRVDVVDAQDGRVLATFADAALERRFSLLGAPSPTPGAVVPPGRRSVIYLEWAVHGGDVRTIEHVVTLAAPAGAQASSLRGARTAVSHDAGAPLGPPLRGGPWVAVHRADWSRGHRRVFDMVDGKARIPGRFAVDWVRADADGRIAKGDADVPANALGYGADVLAVADATVAAVRDGMPEAASVAGNPRHALAKGAGNYVVLRLGDSRYAFYEHLRPSSVAVKPGQRVRRGEVLGQLGFSGDSTGPHLHFHVADGPSPIGNEGRPFVLDTFEQLGSYGDLGALGKAPWAPRRQGEPALRHDEWPAENAVVRFPD